MPRQAAMDTVVLRRNACLKHGVLLGVMFLLLVQSAAAFVSRPARPHGLLVSSSTYRIPTTHLRANESPQDASIEKGDGLFVSTPPSKQDGRFNLTTALFCGGAAFDSYIEPPKNSSRWERGTQGMNVAFVSPAYTRNLYKGLVQIQPIRITNLPDEDSAAESLISGGGCDAYLLVAAVEGQWKEDVEMVEKKTYHDGVLGLMGAAHMGRSRTAWSNVDEKRSKQFKKVNGVAEPYHIRSSWGKGGEAVFTDEEPPFYIYLQDPKSARLVFTVMDADRLGQDSPIGSAHRKLVDLVPEAKIPGEEFVRRAKADVVERIKKGDIDKLDLGKDNFAVKFGPKPWEGEIKLTSKPEKKDKNSQIAAGAAAGAVVAGPVGAAVGGLLLSYYEGEIRGSVQLKLRYLPFPPIDVERKKYVVKGGLPGIDWGDLYAKHVAKLASTAEVPTGMKAFGDDIEHCFFINHEETGCSCSVYRSLETRLILVSFRGTCEPKDLLTDASLVQLAWVEGEDVNLPDVAKVHLGFRNSLMSISRRLKELLLATTAPGEDMSQYDMLVTGHSLGGALATLFVADIAEYGVDAGRGLPQLQESEPWWNSVASTLMGKSGMNAGRNAAPPRPKSLRLYNFGSPRVGNSVFCKRFADLQNDGRINEAYRIVNGNDVIARNPRSITVPVVGSINYDHCGATVLISPSQQHSGDGEESEKSPLIWVEGESDDQICPVRDATKALESPVAKGTLIADLLELTQRSLEDETDDNVMESKKKDLLSKLGKAAQGVQNRLSKVSATDVTSIVGISRDWTDREMRMVQSLLNGEAIAHHMEDEYYGGMGRAAGFVARVGEAILEAAEAEA